MYADVSIHDVSQLETAQVKRIYTPASVQELQAIVQCAPYPIAVAGGRFSQGGHIWYEGGVVIDMSRLNQVVQLDVENKKITVGAGATWHQIQRAIDPFGLSIRVMQSYNDFSVGGSLSVNVHSRTIIDGALIETIESIKLVMADGSLVTASRSENHMLFKAAIGGYGAIGIIAEVTLLLTDNVVIERHEVVVPLCLYKEFFDHMIRHNGEVVFHNGDLSTSDFTKVNCVTWYKSSKLCTTNDRLQNAKLFSFDYFGFQLARYLHVLQQIRLPLQVIKSDDKVVRRNYEMSTSVSTVEPLTRLFTTTVLQEYFIPCQAIEHFVEQMHEIVKKYNVNMLNISIRYIHRDTESILAYAQKEESFALVCYINMTNNYAGLKKAEQWTRELIDCALSFGGTYYLPYQLHAAPEQFRAAYPRYRELLAIKKQVDPDNRFMNSFLQKYVQD